MAITNTTESAAIFASTLQVTERAIYRRAIEAINWGMPAVNLDLMLQAMIGSAKGKPNQIVYWSRLPDWKIQTLTPNPDVIYLKPFFNTKDVGPMVLEIPPADGGSITGTIMDAWQVGAGRCRSGRRRQGQGREVSDPAARLHRPGAGRLHRVAVHDLSGLCAAALDPARAAATPTLPRPSRYAKRIKLYPLSQAGNPPATTFVDAIDVVYDATIPYDVRFFQSLDRVVQIEPWLARDRVMIDMLKSIGIEKGKPFNPDAGDTGDPERGRARGQGLARCALRGGLPELL